MSPDILTRILQRKSEEVAERSNLVPLSVLREKVHTAPAVREFQAGLRARVAAGEPAIIAEIKRASPSQGVIREDFDPAAIARSYQTHGAGCLSVLTDRDFFHGHEDHLKLARAACSLPVLRKDFIVDAWQIYEARVTGADCVLLIVAALDDGRLQEFSALALGLGMDVLVEAHDAEELGRALGVPSVILGINNRSLRNFQTRIDTTLELLQLAPRDRLLVTESGIHTAADVQRLRSAGVNAFLVGEAFMRAEDPGARMAEMFYSDASSSTA